MLIWLASYPRSGNTMLRAMLRQAFSAPSYSLYDDTLDIGANTAVSERVGHRFLELPWDEFYRRHQASPDPVFVKTHDRPLDSGKAIYILRDGRSAIVSWYNVLQRLRQRSDITIADVILGRKLRFGDWSSHLRAWSPEQRPETLLLRYDALIADPAATLARIAVFAGLRQTAEWRNDFTELQKLMPGFFHRGSDAANRAQMSDADLRLFWATHHAGMRDFGFVPDEEAARLGGKV